MANYVVTIRTKDGSLAERDYTANDRAELFQKLAADGVTAVRVSEGVAVKKPRKAVKKAGAPSKGRGLLAAAIVVLGAGLAVWWMMKGEEKGEKKAEPTKEVKVIEEKKVALSALKSVHLPSEKKDHVATDKLHVKKGPYVGQKVTNSFGQVYTVKHVVKAGVRRENGVEIEDKPLFKHDSLNDLDALYRTTPGQRIYGSFDPKKFNKDFPNAIINEKIEITEEDSEDVANRKAMVQDGIAVLKEALKNGENPSELIKAARKELSDLADYRDLCLSAINDMKMDGASYEEVEEYYASINVKLKERNIPALLSPETIKQRLWNAKFLKEGEKK